MAVTQEQLAILAGFDPVSALKDTDQILMLTPNGSNGTSSASKITWRNMRAYLNALNAVTVSSDGYLVIGGEKPGHRIAGVTPLLRRGSYGMEVSTDNGETWTTVLYFTDIVSSSVVDQTLQGTSLEPLGIRPNVLNRWSSVTDLHLAFLAGAQGAENEYKMEFTVSGSSFVLGLPSGVRWSEVPDWQDGWTYQVSVENGLAIGYGWAAEE